MQNSRGHKPLQYVFGPLLSRRLGYSLGVDIIPPKTCTLDCVYCQVGRTTAKTLSRGEWVRPEQLLPELKEAVPAARQVDCITFSGSGEPTLNSNIGEMIRLIKASWQIPVVVLTNGTLLYREDVRTDLMRADIVIPSLDAASPEAFSRVNRPHPELELKQMLAGLRTFSALFQGSLWLEVMLVKGVNDTLAELDRIREATESIRHDKIQINTVIRPPAFHGVEPVGRTVLEQALSVFGSKAEIISDPHVRGISGTNADLESAVLQIIRRRPSSTPQISRSLGASAESVSLLLEKLLSAKRIQAVVHDKETFYTMAEPQA